MLNNLNIVEAARIALEFYEGGGNPSYDRDTENCTYNGPNGEHCAIGAVLYKAGIPISEKQNNMGVMELMENNEEVGELFSNCLINDLWDLQRLHDKYNGLPLNEARDLIIASIVEFIAKNSK